MASQEYSHCFERVGLPQLPLSTVNYVITRQYESMGTKKTMDLEILRLKSVGSFINTAFEPDEPNVPYFSCKFCPRSVGLDVFATADESGILTLHKIKTESCPMPVASSKVLSNAIFGLTWMPDEPKVLVLCGDHTSRLYDVGNGGISQISLFAGHTKSVKTADFMPEDPAVFATGARDGNVLLYDSRAYGKSGPSRHEPDQCISTAVGYTSTCKGKKKGYLQAATVTALAFQDRNSLMCCGATDELIRIWDMRVTHCRWKGMKPRAVMRTAAGGYNDLIVSPDRNKMYVSALSGPISCFNLNSIRETPVAEFHGHEAGSFYVKTCVSEDGEYLASGSTDRAVHIWRTDKAELEREPRRTTIFLRGHRAEVTGVDISRRSQFTVVSCGEDGMIRSWLPTASLLDPKNQDLDSVVAEAPTTVGPIGRKSSINPRNRRPTHLGIRSSLTNRELTPPRRPFCTTQSTDSYNKRKLNTPPKSDLQRLALSPDKSNTEYTSPTQNLPNYVEQGSGPWHSCNRRRQKENLNWFTEIRRKSVDKRSSSNEKERRRSRLSSSKPSSSRRTLLEYYKKSSKCSEEPVKSEAAELAPNPTTSII